MCLTFGTSYFCLGKSSQNHRHLLNSSNDIFDRDFAETINIVCFLPRTAVDDIVVYQNIL